MKSLLKFLLGGILSLLLIGMLVSVAAYFLFDPNDYRQAIARVVESETGRTLKLSGALTAPSVDVDLSQAAAQWALNKGRKKLLDRLFGEKPGAEEAPTEAGTEPPQETEEEKPEDALKCALKGLFGGG